MKKNILIGTLALAAAMLTGCGMQSSTQVEYIGLDAAKAYALQAAGISESAASFSTTGLDKKNGVEYYAVDFTAGGVSYSYDIDAVTGVVIESQTEGTTNTSPAKPVEEVTVGSETQGATNLAQTTTENTTTTGNTTTGNTTAGTATSGYITEEAAKNAALTHAGLTSDGITFVRTKLDFDDGRQVYDVEFYTADYKEYDYEIDAMSGEVVSFDYDAEYYTHQNTTASGNASAISQEKAKEIALGQVPGATATDIYEFETDYDDGRIQYEGKIIYNGMEYEFEIDGYSGAIRNWEAERFGR